MKFGKNFSFGEVVLAEVQYTDTFEVKRRPALILFEEYGNVVVAGITTNIKMKGVILSKKEGIPKDSIIKLNYIFTISEKAILKSYCILSNEKKKIVKEELIKKLN